MNFFKWAKLRVYSESAKIMNLDSDDRDNIRNGNLVHEGVPKLGHLRVAVFSI